jgi:dienelactone hydrolase
VTLGANECDDVRTVVAHLRSSGRVTKIGLWGRSMGAATALFYGATDPSIAALVLDSPFRKLTDLMMELVAVMSSERRVHVPRPLVLAAVAMVRLAILRRARMDISHLDVTTAAARSFVPALFGHASGDTFIRPSHSQALFDAYPGDKNIIHFDGSHNSPRPQFFYDSVSIFFLNTLHPPQAEADTAQPPPSGRAFVPAELPPPAVALARPADEEVSTLMRMGFPRAAAERALRRYSRNVELAASYLIDHASDGWADLMGDDTTLPGAHVASPRAGGASAAAHAFQVVTPRAEGRAFGDADEGDGPSGEATACAEGQEPGMPSGWVLPADAVSHNSSGGAADDRLARALGLSGPAVQQGEEQRRDSVGGSRPGPGQRETKR